MLMATRLPAMMLALLALIMLNRAPPTMTRPPMGPRNCLAALPMADSVYSVSPAATMEVEPQASEEPREGCEPAAVSLEEGECSLALRASR